MFKLVKEIRSKQGELHFKRWQIWSTRWFNIYLHFINKADEDKHLHDHPWSFWSIILKGAYIELLGEEGKHTPSRQIYRGWLNASYRTKNIPHMIGVVVKPTYSLVITGPGGREWGYTTEDGWKNHSKYREEKRLKQQEIKKPL